MCVWYPGHTLVMQCSWNKVSILNIFIEIPGISNISIEKLSNICNGPPQYVQGKKR